ncbi:hypothetical protein ColLi_11426 [Colletotrichum liriopes]|uniref:Uncharacterized protein n=1 Tax=Colletotrichum liriopes TaxID=708192 RepID=A0AA37LYK2_9PEZI|nr:hypothetical protein ColLi_11426 [Colletotrichum liriopes]
MASMNNIRDALDALGALGDVDNASIPPGDNQTHDLPSHVSVELMNLQSLIEKGSSQAPAAIETLFISFWDQYGKNLLLPSDQLIDTSSTQSFLMAPPRPPSSHAQG